MRDGAAVYPLEMGVPRRRGSVRWWQRPLLVVTFPLSLAIFALGFLLPHLRLGRIVKVTVVFLVIWSLFGLLTVWLDPGSGAAAGAEREITRLRRAERDGPYGLLNPSWGCTNLTRADGLRFASYWRGVTPLGRMLSVGLSCNAVVGREMLSGVGLDRQARAWTDLYEQAMVDYAVRGRIGPSYLGLGVGTLLEAVFALPFLVGSALVAVVRPFR